MFEYAYDLSGCTYPVIKEFLNYGTTTAQPLADRVVP